MPRKPIYLRSDVLKVGLSGEGIFSYVALSMMQNKTNTLYTSPQAIWYTMCGTDVPLTRDLKDKLVKGLMELNDYRIITLKSLSLSLYEISTSRLDFDTDHVFFACVYLEEIRKICSYKSGINKFDLIKYFVTMVSSFDGKIKLKVDEHEKDHVAACLPLNLYQKLTGLSKPTLVKYNITLAEVEVLFFTSSSKAHAMNYYCRYENKDALLDYLTANHLLNSN